MKKKVTVNITLIIIMCILTIAISISGSYAATNYAIESKNVEYTDNSSLGVTNVQAAIDGTCTKFNTELTSLKQDMINTIYPIGSIYISEKDDTVSDVESRFGGTWVAYGSGKTIIGAGTGTDANGTSKTFSVSNNSSNLGKYTHSHKYGFQFGSYWGLFAIEADTNAGLLNYSNSSNFTIANDMHGLADYHDFQYNSGINPAMSYVSKSVVYRRIIANSSYEEDIQPYITVYMYKRTA